MIKYNLPIVCQLGNFQNCCWQDKLLKPEINFYFKFNNETK